MNKITTAICIILLSLTVSSCKHKDKTEQEAVLPEQQEAIAEVDTMTLRYQTFQKQLLCNGKLEAIRKADLQCSKQGEILQSVAVVNGQRVAQGALLCVSDTRDRQAELDKARHDLERARIDLQDKLISLGYSGELDKVPADVRHRAEIVSGYYTAKFQLQAARKSLRECELRAPFAGRIANLEARPHQPGLKFATLIDDSYFNVDFKILEAELTFVRNGQTVKITPYVMGNDSYTGTVTGINPTVNDKGMVSVTARVKNRSSKLIDGMNVKVIVENAVPNMLVVPKEAVVERDGYHVVFLYDKKNKRAVWTYVDIVHSNLTSYAITGNTKKETTIKAGDVVITTGNLNLADDTEVRISNQ
jgi:membrane fusion protein (multidrug efflux system)